VDEQPTDLTVIPAVGEILPPATPGVGQPVSVIEASNDDQLIDLWLHGRAAKTQRAYATDIASFLAFVQKPLHRVTLNDLQAYQDSLANLATASQARRLSSVKSLLTFAQKTGYLTLNVGAAIFLPKVKQTLAERILCEDDVLNMLALEQKPRNKAILRLLYWGGLRISEVCGLKCRDLQARDEAGQITVFGKGGKTRVVLLKASMWKDLTVFRGKDADGAVFRSRKGGGHLDPVQVHRIVKIAAARAGLSEAVSAHLLRHAHVSHALDRGAPAHLVQATVGHASLQTTSKYAHARPTDSSSKYLPG
jgi:integrase/recombinase XerD